MPVRRSADPLHVQYVWDSIKASSQQRQTADEGRLIKAIQKLANCSQAQAELYIKQTLDDGLIVTVKRVAAKGQHVGSENESYRINKQEDLDTPVDDGYDWYCIECHLAGDVTTCKSCYRVFHTECSRKASRKQTIFPRPLLAAPAIATPVEDVPPRPAEPKPEVKPASGEFSTIIDLDTSVEDGEETEETESKAEVSAPKPDVVDVDKEPDSDKIVDVDEDIDKPSSPKSPATRTVTSIPAPDTPVISPVTAPVLPSPEKIEPVTDDFIYDESLCSICNLNKYDPGTGLDIEEFNYLLNFILNRIKSWVPEHLTSNLNGDPKYEWHTPADMSWRSGHMFYTHMDMAAVELKIRTKDYRNFSQFQADVLTMVHNIAIFHGVESQEHGAAEFMIRDMEYDIAELQNCVDCYRHSNEKINDKWFCLPCRRPHALVFAKQKGYPYWPAKVMRETDSTFDVRFFGGKYERAILPKNCVKPITTPASQLQIKKTSGFKKAMDEMKLHQSLLDDPGEAARIKSMVMQKPQRKSTPKPLRKSTANVTKSASKVMPKSTPPSRSSLPVAKKTLITPASLSSSIMSDDVYEFHDESVELNGTKSKESTPKSLIASTAVAENASATGSGTSGNTSNGSTKRKMSSRDEDEDEDDDDDDDDEEDLPKRESKSRRTSSSSASTPSLQRTPVKQQPAVPVVPTTPAAAASDIINISDIDDEREGSFHELSDPTQNLVTSSTEHIRDEEASMQKLDQQYCDAVEKMRRKLEQCKTNRQVIVTAMDAMQAEIDRLQNDHNETLRRYFESHNEQISETKKKQWCFNCEQEAIYHCCWNTAYCSPTCQQQHWQAEHKKVCRRKR